MSVEIEVVGTKRLGGFVACGVVEQDGAKNGALSVNAGGQTAIERLVESSQIFLSV